MFRVRSFLITITLLFVGLVAFVPTTAQAQALDELCRPGTPAYNSEVCIEYRETDGQTSQDNRVVDILVSVIELLTIAAGVVVIIAVIVGGLMFVLSAGDSQKTTQARNYIIYSIAGFIIIGLAQLIILFVLDRI